VQIARRRRPKETNASEPPGIGRVQPTTANREVGTFDSSPLGMVAFTSLAQISGEQTPAREGIDPPEMFPAARALGYLPDVHAYEPTPLGERPRDRYLILCFLLFACTSLFVDRLAALDVDFCGEQRMAGALCWYGQHIDPLFLANPQWLRVMSGISAWVFGPLYLLLAWAFWRGAEVARGPALAWAIAILHSMVIQLWMEFFGEYPPARPGALLLVYLPYVIVPIVVLARLREDKPFSRML
jgi:hypothetical protein